MGLIKNSSEMAGDGSAISGMRNVQIYLKSLGVDTGAEVDSLKLRIVWLPILFSFSLICFNYYLIFRFLIYRDPFQFLLPDEFLVIESPGGNSLLVFLTAIVAGVSCLLGSLGLLGFVYEQATLFSFVNILGVSRFGDWFVRKTVERSSGEWKRIRRVWNSFTLLFSLFPQLLFLFLLYLATLSRPVVFEGGVRYYSMSGRVEEWLWNDVDEAHVLCKGKSLYYALYVRGGDRFAITRAEGAGEDVVRWVDQTVRSKGIPRNVDESSIGYRCRDKWADVLE